MRRIALSLLVLATVCLSAPRARAAKAFEYRYAPYNEGKLEPQTTGWPLTEGERKWVLRPEYERRSGSEQQKHLPDLWPVTPSAGFFGGTSWLDLHTELVKTAQANRGVIDVLLVGDSITMQWGPVWQKHFGRYKGVNLGIGGDKTQNVLWRFDHGGVEGLEPRLVVLLIGNNNLFFTPETGIEAAALGIRTCAENLRAKFPAAPLVLVKIFPAGKPGERFYEDLKKTNVALDTLKLDRDTKIHVLDLWEDLTLPDGTLKPELFKPDNVHLTQEGGYERYARRLKPLVEKLLESAR